MDAPFNAYREWLGIDQEQLPPNHYALLGLKELESDVDRIVAACDAAMARVRSHRPGAHARQWQALLDELSTVRECLLDPAGKREYDARLQAELGAPRQEADGTSLSTAVSTGLDTSYLWPPGMGPTKPAQATPAPSARTTGASSAGGAMHETALPAASSLTTHDATATWTASAPAPTAAPAATPASPYATPATADATAAPAATAIPLSGPVAAQAPMATLILPGTPTPPMPQIHLPAGDPMAPVSPGGLPPGMAGPGMAGIDPMAPLTPVAQAVPYAEVAAPSDQTVIGLSPLGAAPLATPVYGTLGAAAGYAMAQTATPLAGSPVGTGTVIGVAPRPMPVATPLASTPSGSSEGSLHRRNNRSSALVYVGIITAAALLFAAMLAFLGDNNQVAQSDQASDTPSAQSGSTPSRPTSHPTSQPDVSAPKPPHPEPKPAKPRPKRTPIGPRMDLQPTPTPSSPAQTEPAPESKPASKPGPTPKPAPTPEPKPTPDPKPVPEPKPAPEPKPKPPTPEPKTATPEQRVAFRKALVAAYEALGSRSLQEAREQLKVAEANTVEPQQQSQLDAMLTVSEGVDHFWNAVRESTKNLKAGEEITIGSTRVLIVEASREKIAIRLAGRTQSFPYERLPAGLAVALSRFWFDASAPSTSVAIGAFLLVEPNGDKEEVRRLWNEANAAGAQIDYLMPLLDEKWDAAEAGEKEAGS